MPPMEPEGPLGDEAAHHAAFLGFYRDTVEAKCRLLPHAELRRPVLASGWTALELVCHLAHMEQRWFVWGFLGEQVADPWGDCGGEQSGRWQVPPDATTDEVIEQLQAGARRTAEILRDHSLTAVSSRGGRFTDTEPPDLRWICFHVLQEYARHAGHLDVLVELVCGATGE